MTAVGLRKFALPPRSVIDCADDFTRVNITIFIGGIMADDLLEAPGIAIARAEGIIPPKQLDGILRGVAAGMVVFHHFCLMLNKYGGHSRIASYHNLARVGASGVDVFFVISGFIITYTLLRRQHETSWSKFTIARIKRVVPLYWLFTLVLVAMWATHRMLKTLVLTPDLLIRSLLFLPLTKYQIGAAPSSHPILDQGWTLQYEAFFYLACAVAIAAVGSRKLFPFASIGVVLCMVAARLIPGAPDYIADPLLLEFVAGTTLGWLAGTGRMDAVWQGRTLAWIAIAVAIVALFLTAFLPDPDAMRAWAWGIPGVLLVFGGVLVKPARSSFLSRAAIYLGTASYSIYLGHGLVVIFMIAVMKSGHFAGAGDGFLLAATAATIAVTSLIYPLLERPIDRLLR